MRGTNFSLKKEHKINNDFSNLYKNQKVVALIDTDSCVGSSLISTSYDGIDGKLAIEDVFNMCDNVADKGDDNFIGSFNDDKLKSLSMSEDFKLSYKKITYVKKHKVKKRMFKIKHKGNEVIITEDHSVMVKRDAKLIECKPNEIKRGDKIIKIYQIDRHKQGLAFINN